MSRLLVRLASLLINTSHLKGSRCTLRKVYTHTSWPASFKVQMHSSTFRIISRLFSTVLSESCSCCRGYSCQEPGSLLPHTDSSFLREFCRLSYRRLMSVQLTSHRAGLFPISSWSFKDFLFLIASLVALGCKDRFLLPSPIRTQLHSVVWKSEPVEISLGMDGRWLCQASKLRPRDHRELLPERGRH